MEFYQERCVLFLREGVVGGGKIWGGGGWNFVVCKVQFRMETRGGSAVGSQARGTYSSKCGRGKRKEAVGRKDATPKIQDFKGGGKAILARRRRTVISSDW